MNADNPEYVNLTRGDQEPPPEPTPAPKQPTRADYKKAMRLFWTVNHPTVEACGHLIDINHEPRTNCNYCWFAFFQEHGELVQTTDELFQQHGPQGVVQLRGTKYLKYFLRFMTVLDMMKKAKETDGTGRTGSGNGEAGNSGSGSGAEASEGHQSLAPETAVA